MTMGVPLSYRTLYSFSVCRAENGEPIVPVADINLRNAGWTSSRTAARTGTLISAHQFLRLVMGPELHRRAVTTPAVKSNQAVRHNLWAFCADKKWSLQIRRGLAPLWGGLKRQAVRTKDRIDPRFQVGVF
jgi:hypothetical protein